GKSGGSAQGGAEESEERSVAAIPVSPRPESAKGALPSPTRVAAKQVLVEFSMARKLVLGFGAILLIAGCQRIDVTAGVSVSTTAKVMKDEVVAKSFKTSAAPQIVVDTFAGAITVV